ncbi:MAG: hypothetical protein WC525_03605 [Candidatus Thermoplasmatota archaeon]
MRKIRTIELFIADVKTIIQVVKCRVKRYYAHSRSQGFAVFLATSFFHSPYFHQHGFATHLAIGGNKTV